jgi:hypothetical protein
MPLVGVRSETQTAKLLLIGGRAEVLGGGATGGWTGSPRWLVWGSFGR